MELPHVFEETHELILGLVTSGAVTGLRVDHPDGLRDPEGYLRRLFEASGGTWVAVEKILEPGEELPPTWPVAGTTGYDFLNLVGGLFVDPTGEKPLTELHARFAAAPEGFAEVIREKKHLVMAETLATDVRRVVDLAVAACDHHRRFRDYTRPELAAAVPCTAPTSAPVIRQPTSTSPTWPWPPTTLVRAVPTSIPTCSPFWPTSSRCGCRARPRRNWPSGSSS